MNDQPGPFAGPTFRQRQTALSCFMSWLIYQMDPNIFSRMWEGGQKTSTFGNLTWPLRMAYLMTLYTSWKCRCSMAFYWNSFPRGSFASLPGRGAVLLPMNFKISSIKITGKLKAMTSIQSCIVKGTTPKMVAMAGMYKMTKWLPGMPRKSHDRQSWPLKKNKFKGFQGLSLASCPCWVPNTIWDLCIFALLVAMRSETTGEHQTIPQKYQQTCDRRTNPILLTPRYYMHRYNLDTVHWVILGLRHNQNTQGPQGPIQNLEFSVFPRVAHSSPMTQGCSSQVPIDMVAATMR